MFSIKILQKYQSGYVNYVMNWASRVIMCCIHCSQTTDQSHLILVCLVPLWRKSTQYSNVFFLLFNNILRDFDGLKKILKRSGFLKQKCTKNSSSPGWLFHFISSVKCLKFSDWMRYKAAWLDINEIYNIYNFYTFRMQMDSSIQRSLVIFWGVLAKTQMRNM